MTADPQSAETRMRELLYDFRRYFEQLKEEGVEFLEMSSPGGLPRRRRPSPVAAPVSLKPPTAPAVPPSPDPPPAGVPAAPARKRIERPDPRAGYCRLLEEIAVCRKCVLARTRKNSVPGEGGNRKRVLFIGEGPGAEEDRLGRPFVGRSGKLLDQILASVSLSRKDVYITNIVKCRPPDNRDPAPDEAIACWPYLETQIKLLRPRLIVTLGLPAARTLLESVNSLGRLRGRIHDCRGIPLLATYHPAYILRAYTPENRKKAWADIKMVRDFLAGTGK